MLSGAFAFESEICCGVMSSVTELPGSVLEVALSWTVLWNIAANGQLFHKCTCTASLLEGPTYLSPCTGYTSVLLI
jgi:hypothetical protein